MVSERTTGRRLRCRYAAVTDVSTGPSPRPRANTARHCRYRAFGLVMGEPFGLVYGEDQALQVSSGVSVLPLREYSSILSPFPVPPRQLSDPHVAIICASRGSDSYVPFAARSSVSLNSLPGFAVA